MSHDEYLAAVQQRADALIEAGDLDAIIGAMDPHEWNRWQINLRVIVRCKAERSRQRATDEIRELLRSGAFKSAQEAYKAEMAVAAKQAALERHYRMMERCAA